MDLEETTPEDLKLYRLEYLDEDLRMVDWIWLAEEEVDNYLQSRSQRNEVLLYRAANAEEEELYNEAYNDGYGIAISLENERNDNGVTFRVDGFDPESLEIQSTKMFECAICGEHKDFETDVAMANGFYISIAKGHILWHVCYDCTTLELDVE